MKNKVLVAVVIVAAVGAGALVIRNVRRGGQQASSTGESATTGAKGKITFIKDPATVPHLVLQTLDGRTLDSDDWKGKVVIVNFWATWCPPCREEIPDLIKLQQQYKDQLLIIGISSDTGPTEEVAKFAADHRMNYPIVMETPEILAVFPGVFALPTTFVVDGGMKMVKKHVGLLNPEQVELETRYLAKLPVNADVEHVADAGAAGLANQAQATDVPGLKLDSLKPEQKTAALKRLNQELCGCGCGLTLAQCRINDPTCTVSLPLAEKIVEQARTQ